MALLLLNDWLTILFKTKFRIIKKTGYIYKSFLEQKNLKNIDLCRVIFFGHSLDILDK